MEVPAFLVVKYIIFFFFLPPIPAHRGPEKDTQNTIKPTTLVLVSARHFDKSPVKMMHYQGEMSLKALLGHKSKVREGYGEAAPLDGTVS